MWWFFSKTGFCHQFVVYKKQLRLTYSATTWSRELLYYLFKNFAMTFTESDSPVYTLQLIYNTVYNRFVFYLLRTICFYLLKLYNKKDSSVIKLRIWRGNERFIRKKYFRVFFDIPRNLFKYISVHSDWRINVSGSSSTSFYDAVEKLENSLNEEIQS